jgi:hypothetical protein
MLESELDHLEKQQIPDKGMAGLKRVRLALANAYLMKALWALENQQLDLKLLERARSLFQWIEEAFHQSELSLAGKYNRYAVLVGLAIIHHVRDELELAYAGWERAEGAAEDCWPKRGYAAMVTLYSRSEVAHRLKLPVAGDLTLRAKAIFEVTSRQYWFVGQGSIWPDLVGDLEERSGRERMMPRR